MFISWIFQKSYHLPSNQCFNHCQISWRKSSLIKIKRVFKVSNNKMNKKMSKQEGKNFQAVVIAENLKNIDWFYCLHPCPIESPLEKTL